MVYTAAWAAILRVMSAHTRRAWLTHPDWGAPVGVVESVIRRHNQSLLDALCACFLIHTDHPTRRQQHLFLTSWETRACHARCSSRIYLGLIGKGRGGPFRTQGPRDRAQRRCGLRFSNSPAKTPAQRVPTRNE